VKMSLIARTTSKLVAPFLVTYAAYLMLYGAYSPGGGFQAGVILAVAVILLITSHGYRKVRKRFRKKAVSSLETSSGLGIAFLLLLLALTSLNPNENLIGSFNILAGIKVGAAFVLIFYSLIAFLERD